MQNMQDSYSPDCHLKVSYLQARDPSILSWNRHGIHNVRHNLVNDFGIDTMPSTSSGSDPEDNHMKVYLRIKNGEDYDNLYAIEGKTLVCTVPQGSHTSRNQKESQKISKKFEFSKIFGPETTQQELFNDVIKGKILNFINGYNNTLLAYGASGSGKTFTMVGTADQPGIIPRALEYLFRTLPTLSNLPQVKPLHNGKVLVLNQTVATSEIQVLEEILPVSCSERHIKTYKAMQQRLSTETVATIGNKPPILGVYVSFAEIYNEFLYDLLQASPGRGQQRPKLKVGGFQDHTYIKGLKYVYVRSGLEAYQILQYGINNLKYADTAVNSHSSRSHCIFTIRLVQGFDIEQCNVSLFNFCDLAGSERLKKTFHVGDRLKESNNINGSLLVLGRCISNIRDGQYNKENKLPPFRESKLTQIFQCALMGKEDIVMIVNINPNEDMFDESQHTLNFAAIAKEIMIDEPTPIFLSNSRFSACFKQREGMPYIEEDEREEELQELRNERANLVLELSELRQEMNETIEAERQHLRGLFEEIIKMKDSMIENLEKEKEKLLQEKKKTELIVLSDSEDEDSEGELSNLKMENHKLKTEIYNLKLQNNHLENKLDDASKKFKDTKTVLSLVTKQNEELQRELRDLKIEFLKLKDNFTMQQLELQDLRKVSVIDKDDIETLENENRVLRKSVHCFNSPSAKIEHEC